MSEVAVSTKVQASLRDAVPSLIRYPALETPGYFQKSLRDLRAGASVSKRVLGLDYLARDFLFAAGFFFAFGAFSSSTTT